MSYPVIISEFLSESPKANRPRLGAVRGRPGRPSSAAVQLTRSDFRTCRQRVRRRPLNNSRIPSPPPCGGRCHGVTEGGSSASDQIGLELGSPPAAFGISPARGGEGDLFNGLHIGETVTARARRRDRNSATPCCQPGPAADHRAQPNARTLPAPLWCGYREGLGAARPGQPTARIVA